MSDFLHRHWLMLREIPRAPRKISSSAIAKMLATHGYEIDVRSIQRDLHKLSTIFPLRHDDARPLGWFYARDAPPFDVPGLDAHSAITLSLVEAELAHQLPRATLESLRPHFAEARQFLANARSRGFSAWRDKMRVIPRALKTLPPVVEEGVLAAVYDALLEERCLALVYRARQKPPARREVHPLALVYRDGIGYLVCTHDGYADVRTLALHRVVEAELLKTPRTKPKGFDLDRFIDEGALSFRLAEEPIDLVARFHPDASASVTETPLAASQKVSVLDDGWTRVEVRLEDTRVLRSFLLGFGALVEVERPKALRRALRETAKQMVKLYKD